MKTPENQEFSIFQNKQSWREDEVLLLKKAPPAPVLAALGYDVVANSEKLVTARKDGAEVSLKRDENGEWLGRNGSVIDIAMRREAGRSLNFIGKILEDFVKRVNPALMWSRLGFSVEQSSSELRVSRDGHCLYRSWLTNSGEWASGPKDAGYGRNIAKGVGGNLSVYRYFKGDGDMKACPAVKACLELAALSGACHVADRKKNVPDFPNPPEFSDNARRVCRNYLKTKRRIPEKIIDLCEKANLLSYHAGYGANPPDAVFQGFWTDGRFGFGAKRAAAEKLPEGRKRALNISGSKLACVPVFMGSDTVFVVEGGVNLLSVLAMCDMAGLPLPTVFMSSGQGNRGWFEEPENARGSSDGEDEMENLARLARQKNREILKGAKRVYLVGENDDEAANCAHHKENMAQALKKACGGEFSLFPVPLPCNDLNDLLCANPELLLELATDRLSHNRTPRQKQEEKCC